MLVAERNNLGALIELEACGERILITDCRVAGAPVPWTGRAIEAASNAVARALTAAGLARGQRIAIISENRVEYLSAYFGAMRAGLVAVPVNHKLAPDTVRYILDDADIRFVFADAGRAPLCLAHVPRVNFDDEAAYRTFLQPGPFAALAPAHDEVAMFLYTSGSTGRPKGVPLTHAGQLWVCGRRRALGVDYGKERILVAAPLYHMNALALAKFACFAGASMVLLPRFDANSYIDAIAQHQCTWITSVPTMMALVMRETEHLAAADRSCVTSVRMGSAPVTLKLLRQVKDAFPGAGIQLGYGTTEAGPVVFAPHPDGIKAPDLAFGVAHPQVELRLVDSAGQESAEGVLELRCPALMPGYHNLPEKTRAVFTDDGFYKTGDVMRRDEQGFYYFVGRDDDMFVCNGENVFPEQVERLLELHGDVIQACVVPVADAVRGHMPVAFVVPRPGAERSVATLKQHVIANGPAYQHPRHICFLESLPLASTNKIDRNRLAAMARQRVMAHLERNSS
ncbi:MAG: AMP-binding protein [Gammaproteobacteria bacterium]|nr:AMP-binding protein [Gammaproteobacteria bacterium]